jgi:1,4-alpha-glucan branching enzyme
MHYDISRFDRLDITSFQQGHHARLFEKFGAHIMHRENQRGTYFAVWAPNAKYISVIGEFNQWNTDLHPLKVREDRSGIWEGFAPDVDQGNTYKYHVVSQYHDYTVDKTDPFARYCEQSPQMASIVWDVQYAWQDEQWMRTRKDKQSLQSPFSVYEVHLGSWYRIFEQDNRFLTYRELAQRLTEYVLEMGFTHVQFLPVMEHPFYGSWGYQCLGYFAPTSRYGTPQDLMYLIDVLHQNGIGVLLDWVPSHFPTNETGLVFFDGTHLFEHMDPKLGFHPDWKSSIFNYGRNEVRAFLLSSALFWLEYYHADGIRVDAVASMLYLDYGREDGQWIPNKYGGRENLEAIEFIRTLNETLYAAYPDIMTVAEESTSWPMVTKPTYTGGLGFGMKWNMGWMHDTLEYFTKDPVFRKYHHSKLTFSVWYAFAENFVLPLSHDEVVYGKHSLLEKMPGDDWQKFANLRLLFGYMYTYPGKKLLFMGGEFGQRQEWYHEESLSWSLLNHPSHHNLQRWVKELNLLHRYEPVFHLQDFEHQGFQWIDFSDHEKCIICFLRKGRKPQEGFLIACNFTPVPRHNYRLGVPWPGLWLEHLNSDAKEYGGSGQGNLGGCSTTPIPMHGHYYSLVLTLPPLALLIMRYQGPTGSLLSDDSLQSLRTRDMKP